MQKLSKIFEHDHLKGENTDEELLHEDIIPFLLSTTSNGDVPVFTSGNGFYIYSIVMPFSQIPEDPSDISKFSVMFDSSYGYSSSFKPQSPDDFGLSLPGECFEPEFLRHGVPVTFLRDYRFNEKKSYIEFPQDFVQMFRLHIDDETGNMCRIDENGDKEEVCRIQLSPYILVTIKSEILFAYLHLKKYAWIRVFESMRSKNGKPHWTKFDRIDRSDKIKGIYARFQDNPSDDYHCSLLLGGQIIGIDRKEVWEEAKKELVKIPDNKYCEFITLDVKNKRIAECSCAPDKMSNYFEPENDKPFELSPVFFKPEVLDKFKNNPNVYKLDKRRISKIGGWHLQSYDVNEKGQVHTYLIYLSKLLYSEQLYWRSFNEEPKGNISKRAYKTDFKGEFPDTIPPDELLIYLLEQTKNIKTFFKNIEYTQLNQIHRVHTDNEKEWTDLISLLDKTLIETLDNSLIQSIAQKRNCIDPKKKLGSIRLLQRIFKESGIDENIIEPLAELHELRCKITDHKLGSEGKEIIKDVRKRFKSFPAHFDDLLARLCETLKKILDFEVHLEKQPKEDRIKE